MIKIYTHSTLPSQKLNDAVVFDKSINCFYKGQIHNTSSNKKIKNTAYLLCVIFTIFMGIGKAIGQSATYFTTIAKGFAASHSLGIKNDGTLWAWGYNGYGQLGDDTTFNISSPLQVGAATNWVSVFVGNGHSLGITADGKLWAWGDNSLGQLGDSSTTEKHHPVQIGTATNWVNVSAGGFHSLGITSDGKLWAWGNNYFGQLGDSTNIQKNIPTQVGTATNWVNVSAGGYHSHGITSDGKLWAWGNNYYGQLGDSTNMQKNIPTQVGAATNWVNVSAGGAHSLGITSNGKLWAWGNNSAGQLGDSIHLQRNVPSQVDTATNWVNTSAGANHSLGITADSKLWAWGSNDVGQLGDNTTINTKSPIQVGSATNWVNPCAGGAHSLGITSNGKLWAWGNNSAGQLGDGTNLNESIPLQLPGQPTIATGLATTGSIATMQQGQYNIFTSGGSFIANVGSTKASLTPITGLVTAKVWVETSQTAQYVNRRYQITPASNAATVTGRITLYFLQAEFDAFNVANSTKLPKNATDAAGIANLLIEKRSGVSSDGSGLPNTYPTTTTPKTIDPADADIVWNTTLNRWEISFDVNGFSGFFVKTQPVLLPLQLISFIGSRTNDVNHLQWITSNEINTKQFIIEWSMDALQWKSLGTITATGFSNNTYSYNHSNTPSGKIFYKLKMVDQDGKITYSNIIWLKGGDNTGVVIYPNPVKNVVNINVSTGLLNTIVSMTTLQGKLLQRILINKNQQSINVQQLPKAVYLLNFADGTVAKFIKE